MNQSPIKFSNTNSNGNGNGNGSGGSGYFISSDGYVVLAFLALVIMVIGGTIMVESAIPHMRSHFVNNIGAFVLSILAVALIWHYSGKSVSIFGRSFNAGYFAYVVIIVILLLIFSG